MHLTYQSRGFWENHIHRVIEGVIALPVDRRDLSAVSAVWIRMFKGESIESLRGYVSAHKTS